ncbi:MAG TPA: SH3 domain-containing protein [Anaerolineales bacterium]|jgi:hypothetical protein|nr:SH3 domain-containing protein [Anaerolineales bacterium]
MNRNDWPSLINIWTIGGALFVAGFLLLATLISIGWLGPRHGPDVGLAPADVTVIPPPTATVLPSPTPIPEGTITPPPGQIAIGAYVQINGTEGSGLRIRSAPGLASDTVFRGEEAETFQVKDGPQQVDGYVWWYLVAPYDNSRAGWAAADFLAVVPSP